MAGEKALVTVTGQVMTYDLSAKQWHPAGTSSGLSTVRLIQCPNQTFRIHGQKINEDKEVVLDSLITREVKYNRANEAFIQWHDSKAFWGLNFRRGSPDAESFFNSVIKVLEILNRNAAAAAQVVHQQANLQSELTSPQQQLQHQHPPPQQQQPPQQQNSAAIIQRSMQQQQQHILQQPPQQMVLQQQPPVHVLAQQPNTMMQPNQQQILQQHQLHQQYMHQQQQHQRQPLAQPQPNDITQMNHHHQQLHQQQQHIQHQLQQQQQQIQQQQHQQQQHQQQQMQQRITPAATAPIPPPPPPPPPAPPIMNSSRVNGTSTNIVSSAIPASNNLQHSPVASSTNNHGLDSNGRNDGSPNQASLLANELANCRLRKVNVSRSDSDKESECNNNHIPHAKTTRAASIANVPSPGDLMNEMSKKLAGRKERIDGLSGNNGNSSNGLNQTNGVGGDKVQDNWLADLICKEISKEITKMKAEIIDAIKTELRQR